MATIGVFKKIGEEFHGEVITLSVQAKTVRIAPNPSRRAASDSSHLIFVGPAEIGQAWSTDRDDVLLVSLDDPSFAAEIVADLVGEPEGGTFKLVWFRPPGA